MLGETLKELLEQNDYSVDLVDNGEKAIELSFDKRYNLYIFDINVPIMDGFELLSSLRHADDFTPTIFISALVDIKSISKGFQLGAQDYIKKPFFPQELLIRVDAKINKLKNDIIYKDLSYNPNTKELYKNNSRLILSPMLTQMLHIFLTNQNKIIIRDDLLECMEHPTSTALRVAITKLKQLTSLDIKNIRAIGYTLESC